MKTYKLRVPPHQRSYAWGESNVKAFLEDIGESRRRREEEYFLGSIVAVDNRSGRFEVVDGQQRLATASILIAAIRDYFFGHNDRIRADEVERQFLLTRDLRTMDSSPNFTLNMADHEFYLQRVLSLPGSSGRVVSTQRGSHSRIVAASDLCRDYLENLVADLPDPTSVIVDWLGFLEGNAKVIWVAASDDSKAFILFETLNDRGIALAITDLLKNHLFSRAGDRFEEIQQKWVAMTEMLESTADENLILSYLRHFWLSKHGVTRTNELYASIKRETQSSAAAVSFADELHSNTFYYSNIVSPDHGFWDRYGPNTFDYVTTLNDLGIVQIRPLLLAVLAEFETEEIKKAVKLAVSWAMRLLTVGRSGSGFVEELYSRSAVAVRRREVTSASALTQFVAEAIPTDAEFRSAFETFSVTKADVARYILRELEFAHIGDRNPALIANPNTRAVNLEHVMPRRPSGDWQIDLDEAKAYLNRIGNLALLETRLNSSIQNSAFETKRPYYRDSAFALTKDIGEREHWDTTSITSRQLRLARLAVSAWPAS